MKTQFLVSGATFLLMMLDGIGLAGGGKQGIGLQQKDAASIVSNNGKPIFAGDVVSFSKDLTIGEMKKDDKYAFSRISGIDVDAEGNIYIVDAAAAQVRIFDSTGEWKATFGRKGQGPGEFQMPIYVQIVREQLVVFDYPERKAVRFSMDGSYLGQIKGSLPFSPVRLDPDGYSVGRVILAPLPIGGIELKLFGPDLKPALDIFKEAPGKDPKTMFVGKPSLCCAAGENGTIYWGYSDRYEIHISDQNGKTIKTIKNKYDHVRISANDRSAMENELRDFTSRGGMLRFADTWPAYNEFQVDEKGRLFVKTFQKSPSNSEHAIYDIFDAEGRFIARQSIPIEIGSPSRWKNEKLYALTTDEEGGEHITRYSVRWSR